MSERIQQIRVERVGRMLIVTPADNLGELEYEEFEPETQAALNQYQRSDAKHLIIDLHNAEFLGSSTIGWLLKLRRLVASRQGQMALCGVSATAREVLDIMHITHHWSVYASREEAMAACDVAVQTQ